MNKMDKYVEQKLKELLQRCKNKAEEVKEESSDDFTKGFEVGSTMVIYELEEFIKTYLD
jgi:hypothetical protein